MKESRGGFGTSRATVGQDHAAVVQSLAERTVPAALGNRVLTLLAERDQVRIEDLVDSFQIDIESHRGPTPGQSVSVASAHAVIAALLDVQRCRGGKGDRTGPCSLDASLPAAP